MDRENKLIKNTLIISIGTLSTKLVQFFLIPLYTRFLSPSEYGIVELFITITSLCIPIISFQIEQGMFRFLVDSRNNKKNIQKIVSTTLFFVLLCIITFSSLFVLISFFIKVEYKFFILINTISCLVNILLLQVARGLGNNKVYSIAGVITGLSTVIFNIIFLVFLNLKAFGMLTGTLLGYIIGIIYLFVKLKIYSFISIRSFDKKELKKLLNYSLPLVPNQISWWIFGTSDRFIVSYLLGLASTGILSIGYKFSNAYIQIYNVFNLSWTESVTLHINDYDFEKYFNDIFNKMVKLFSLGGICIISTIPFIFKIFVSSSYYEAYFLIPIAIVATIFQMIVGLISTIYIAKNDTKIIATTSVLSAVLNVSSHLLLLKHIGLYAAVVSTLISYVFFSCYRFIDINKKYNKISFIPKNVLIILFSATIVLLSYYSKNLYFIFMTTIVSYFTFLFENKWIFKDLKKILIKKQIK